MEDYKEKAYIGTKIVQACPMTKHEFRDYQGNESDGRPDENGYKVTYEDGYKSWSPQVTFERAYRLLSDSEKSMM